MKTIEQFWNEITENKELGEKLASASEERQLDEFLKENEVDCTKEQFKAFVNEKVNDTNELTDEELEAVSGGDYYIEDPVGAGILEKSPYKAEIWQHVEVYDIKDMVDRPGTVIGRRCALTQARNNGRLYYYVEYLIEYDNHYYYDEWVNGCLVTPC